MEISAEAFQKLKQTLTALQQERLMSWNHWRDLADYYLPRRYVWLLSATERNSKTMRNPVVLDGHGTKCARTLASGMMNGITSPSRPWFKLRISGFEDDLDYDARVWLDDVERRMMLVMASSNFYNALATMYLDLVVFGTACMLIYEDYENVIHCFNPALGEFYLAQDDRHRVNTVARTFKYKVHQIVGRWGKENCSRTIQEAFTQGGARLQDEFEIAHIIQPNGQDGYGSIAKHYKFKECYWEVSSSENKLLGEFGGNMQNNDSTLLRCMRPTRSAEASSFTGMVAIIRVQANGAMMLERTFFCAPSIAMMRERPMMPSLAAA